jgi:hypothetical protein
MFRRRSHTARSTARSGADAVWTTFGHLQHTSPACCANERLPRPELRGTTPKNVSQGGGINLALLRWGQGQKFDSSSTARNTASLIANDLRRRKMVLALHFQSLQYSAYALSRKEMVSSSFAPARNEDRSLSIPFSGLDPFSEAPFSGRPKCHRSPQATPEYSRGDRMYTQWEPPVQESAAFL